MGQILSALIRKGIVAANAKKFSVKVSRVLSTQFPELFNMISENSGTFPPVSSCPSRLEHYPSARDQKGQDDSHRNVKNIHRKSSTKRVVIEKQTTYGAFECSAHSQEFLHETDQFYENRGMGRYPRGIVTELRSF